MSLQYYSTIVLVVIMTNAELAILSLVAEEPRHGYQIDQVIRERGMREWADVAFSSIYFVLKKLEREGLIGGMLEETERGPARKVYQATVAGRAALHAGVLNALSVPDRCTSSLQLGLANLPTVQPSEARVALGQYRDALTGRLEQVRERRKNQRPVPDFVEAMFEHSTTMIRAELTWVEGFIARMEARDDQA
jgi:DNA-binding PadR family transcriptional regulator